MTVRFARRGELPAMAVLLLLAGMGIGSLVRSDWQAPVHILSIMSHPYDQSLVFIGAGLVSSWLRQRVAASVCGFAALVIIALGIETSTTDLYGFIGEGAPLAVSALLLSIGTIFHSILSPERARFQASATFHLAAGAVCLVFLVSVALGSKSLSAGSLSIARGLGGLAMGLAGVHLAISASHAAEEKVIQWLVTPLAVSGLAAITAICGLLWRSEQLAPHERIGGMAVAVVFVLWLTVAGAAAAALGARMLKLLSARAKLERMLRRQRKMMHSRAAALRASKARYRELFDNVPAPVVLTQPSGDVLAANPAALSLLGIDSEAQIKAMNFSRFYARPEDRQRLVDEWRRTDRNDYRGEVTLRRIDGEHLNVLFATRMIRAQDGTIECIQGTITDITELRKSEARRRKLEANLQLSQKLESVGRLAAGIAHEINTPMQYIGDNIHFITESFGFLRDLLAEQKKLMSSMGDAIEGGLAGDFAKLEDEFEVEDTMRLVPGALERAREGVESVSHIVAAMKELAHPGKGVKVSTDINHLVDTALTVTKNEYKTVADIDVALGNIPNILTYKNELCQVLINLIVNAAHAIESARGEGRPRGRIAIATAHEDDAVLIRVSDNGCGIPETVVDKIFDPFFTTKGVGQGTGQGLAIARTTVVDKHSGQISVESTVGAGTTFSISLPVTDAGADTDQATKETV